MESALSLQRARDEEYAGSNFFVERREDSLKLGLNEEWNAFERGQCAIIRILTWTGRPWKPLEAWNLEALEPVP